MFQSTLAVRCWRDLDDGETATNDALHQQVLGQLDRSLDRALAVILISRLNTFRSAEGEAKAAAWAFLKVLGPVADRAARSVDAEVADQLMTAWANEDGTDVDAGALVSALNTVLPCP